MIETIIILTTIITVFLYYILMFFVARAVTLYLKMTEDGAKILPQIADLSNYFTDSPWLNKWIRKYLLKVGGCVKCNFMLIFTVLTLPLAYWSIVAFLMVLIGNAMISILQERMHEAVIEGIEGSTAEAIDN